MSKCCSGVNLTPTSNQVEVALRQLRREVKELLNTTTARLLCQDKKIAETMVYIKANLSNEIRNILDVMYTNGELEAIITETVLAQIDWIQDEINNNNLFYGHDIYTERLYDDISGTGYYITHVPVEECSGQQQYQLHLGIANDDLTFSSLESTIDFAHRKHATICINAGFFDMDYYKPRGGLIMDGNIVYRDSDINARYNYLTVSKNGKLGWRPADYSLDTMLCEGIVQAVCGTVILIDNNHLTDEFPDEERHPRQAIGQRADNEIIILTCDGRDLDDNGMTYTDLQRIFHERCCVFAMNLDGGGSTSTVLRGIKENENIDQYNSLDRKVANYLYIRKPTVYDVNQIVCESWEAIGKVKQELIERIVNSNDVEKGFIRLLAKEGFLYPGIEVYADGSEVRTGKIGYNDTNNFFVSLINPSTESDVNVFKADLEDLYSAKGRLARFYDYPKRVPNADCNVTGIPMSLFYCFKTDTNAPEGENCLLLHIPFTSNLNVNLRQYKLPMNNREPVMIRSCSSAGVWSAWSEINNQDPEAETIGIEGE